LHRASATGAFATLAEGHAVSALLFTFSYFEMLTLHFTIIAGSLALVSAVIFILVSRHSAPPANEQIRQFTFHHQTMQKQTALGWWQDYRVHSLILILLTTALLIAHW